jgi:arylsulfatase A-like enzyme
LTGHYPAALHLTDWLPGRTDRPSQKMLRPIIQQRLPTNIVTLPKALKSKGYVSGIVGKWHLGGTGSLPKEHGFDFSMGAGEIGMTPSFFFPYKNKQASLPDLDEGQPGEYLTDRLTSEAEKFIEQNKARPFFLYLAHYAVHIPLAGKKEIIEKYHNASPSGSQTNYLYAAMIEGMDESVGRIMKKLDELNLTERTLVIFTSDNGGLSVQEGESTPATSNAPLRDGKGYLYEGGIREPLIARWPGQVKPGAICNVPVSSVDFMPTFLEIAGANPISACTNGVSLVPLFQGAETNMRPALFWHYPHYSNQGGKPGAAIRMGEFKLIEFYEDGHWELYNLADDPGERKNLTEALPKKAAELQAKLEAWRRATQAQMMKPNPDYDPNAASLSLSAAKTVSQSSDGTILLHARDVTIHGTTVRYEPQTNKNTIGYWTKKEDWVSWNFEVKQPGTFEVEILQGCGKGSGGAEVEFSVAEQTLPMKVIDTGHFQNFLSRKIGQVHLEKSGTYTLAVKPKTKPGVAVMDLRSVNLIPAK